MHMQDLTFVSVFFVNICLITFVCYIMFVLIYRTKGPSWIALTWKCLFLFSKGIHQEGDNLLPESGMFPFKSRGYF